MALALRQIYLKNFRVFENLSFPIKPITILTGPNSSGKSSIVKALLLLQDNLEKYHLGQLDFSNDTHRLGSFESVKTRGSAQDTLEFGLEYEVTDTTETKDQKSFFQYKNFTLIFTYSPLRKLNGSLQYFGLGSINKNEKGEIIDGLPLIILKLLNNKYHLAINLPILGRNLIKRGAINLLLNQEPENNNDLFTANMDIVKNAINSTSFSNEFDKLTKEYNANFKQKINTINSDYTQQISQNKEINTLENKIEKTITEFEATIGDEKKEIVDAEIKLQKEKEQLENIQNEEKELNGLLRNVENELAEKLNEEQVAELKIRYSEESDFSLANILKNPLQFNNDDREEITLLFEQIENYDLQLEQKREEYFDKEQLLQIADKTLNSKKDELTDKRNEVVQYLIEEKESILKGIEIQRKREIQIEEEALKNKIEALIEDNYYSEIAEQIENYCFSKIGQLNYSVSISQRKHSTLMDFLFSKDWEGQIEYYVNELIPDKLGDILQDIPELDFLNNDAVWSLKLGEILKDGEFNQITTTLIAEIRVFIDTLLSQIPFTYTSGIRGLQQRFYNTAGVFDLDKSISQLLELQNQNATTKLEFINEWLKEFEIGKTIRAEQIDGSYIDAKIDGTVSIADMGLGMSQLLPIIITTAYYLDQNYLIVIEEPESHLHPKLQSKLADFMVAANKKGVQFMVETHSVHFIRMIEDFIANHQSNNQNDGTKLDPNDFQMCYFNSNIEGHYTVMPIGENGDILEHNKADLEEFYDPRERRRAKKEVTEQKETINKLKLELEQLRLKKCLLLTEDDDINLLKKILTHSGFNLDEVHFISYEGCCKIDATRVVAQFVNEQFPEKSPYIVVHRDRDYLTDEEVCKEEEKFKACNVTLFITKGTDIEWYLLSAEHIHKCHSKISINLAEDLIKKAAGFKFEEAKHRLFLKEYGDKYKNKSCHGKERLEELIKNDKRYWYGKGVYGYLKQLIKNECKDNAKLEQLTNAIQIPELIQIAQQIWGKSPQNP